MLRRCASPTTSTAPGLDTDGLGPALPADVELARAERRDLRRRRLRAAADDPARAGAVVPGAITTRCGSRASSPACSRGRSAARSDSSRSATGAVVREFQPAQWGWTPALRACSRCARGWTSARARWRRSGWSAWRTSRSAAARSASSRSSATPRRDDGSRPRSGMGVHPFRDPALTDEFDAPRVAIDVARVPRLRRRLAARAGRLPRSTAST